ncbi:hypothetical protein KCP75_05360 [Salmonella enterica subsp. enterica]|nr:hypothetical protein KCP75_05360 [Salmonella enterica subsp. enterica]
MRDRPVIVKAFLADAVYQAASSFTGIYRISSTPSGLASSFTASIPTSFGTRRPGQNSHPINEYPPSPSAPATKRQ